MYKNTKQFCVLQLPISYCVSLIIVRLIRHIFINIFKKETLFNCEILCGSWEKIKLSCSTKNLQKFEKMDWAPLSTKYIVSVIANDLWSMKRIEDCKQIESILYEWVCC